MVTAKVTKVTRMELHELKTESEKEQNSDFAHNLLSVSAANMPDMRCYPIGGMKFQHDAVFESLGIIEEIKNSLNRLS